MRNFSKKQLRKSSFIDSSQTNLYDIMKGEN